MSGYNLPDGCSQDAIDRRYPDVCADCANFVYEPNGCHQCAVDLEAVAERGEFPEDPFDALDWFSAHRANEFDPACPDFREG